MSKLVGALEEIWYEGAIGQEALNQCVLKAKQAILEEVLKCLPSETNNDYYHSECVDRKEVESKIRELFK